MTDRYHAVLVLRNACCDCNRYKHITATMSDCRYLLNRTTS
jgi:hypothetical protein